MARAGLGTARDGSVWLGVGAVMARSIDEQRGWSEAGDRSAVSELRFKTQQEVRAIVSAVKTRDRLLELGRQCPTSQTRFAVAVLCRNSLKSAFGYGAALRHLAPPFFEPQFECWVPGCLGVGFGSK
eukprot:2747505-Rhodomonas_salina.1